MALDICALAIQSAFRGYLVRRHFPKKLERESAIQLIADSALLNRTPTASSGVNRVYLPPDHSFVIKHLGYERAGRRFRANWHAAHLGYQYLIVPWSVRYEDFTIERKLPVEEVTLRSQTRLYIDNLPLFSAAAKEFTQLLLAIRLDDFVTKRHPFIGVADVFLARHDNVPLMIEEGYGKVALIDLGGYQVRTESADKRECVKIALALFPYHLDEICSVAEVDKSDFIAITQETQKIFRLICPC